MFARLCLGTLFLTLLVTAASAEDVDYTELVKSLASKNSEPMKVGSTIQKQFLFPKDFDWKDQDRIVKVVSALAKNRGESWRALVEGLDDDTYCITLEGDMSSLNWTVSMICRRLLKEAISEGYSYPPSQFAYSKMGSPDYLPRKGAELKEWFEEQIEKERTLADLQIEAADWALDALAELDADQVPQERIDEAIAETKKLRKQIRKSGEPILNPRFFGEDRSPYSKERAERMRLGGR
jgi:hypothetical protein